MKGLYEEIQLDNIDLEILRLLQNDSQINNSELARRINLSQPATHKRIKRLHKLGVIQRHVALLNRELIGLDLVCFMQIRLRTHSKDALTNFQATIEALTAVLECYHLTGEFDYLLKVVFKNRRELENFITSKLIPRSEVFQINTSIVLSEVKSTTVLPLPTR